MLKIIFSIFLLVSSVAAEESGIFGDDYDMNVFKPRPSSGAHQPPTTTGADAVTELTDTAPTTNTASPLASPASRQQVKWLGLIVNAQDQSHFFAEIRSFLQFVQENDYDLGPIYAIGKRIESSEMNAISAQIDGRGGELNFNHAPPAQYPVKQSPAWIVGTKDGQVVLEGLNNFQRYFNSSGELLINSNS